ncbi:efflux RND transporter periplasmic adaptor subunit [Planctomicrobium sp. SH527]|uniref:efflux RND transporter periplasmic adaptor subunit n=1 Tax=Planctomicrobium sp. SH527 TaxID=3448123 RepID=UPI003F5C6622
MFLKHGRYSAIIVAAITTGIAWGHEGHQPLPTKGVQIELETGHLTLSRDARELLDVTSEEVQTRDLTSSVRSYVTSVAPWTDHAFVTSILPGRISELHVRPGDTVKQGQILATLDSLGLQALQYDYQRTQNELQLSAKLLESLAPATQSGAVPGQRLVETENAHLQSQNSLDVIRAKSIGLGLQESDLSASTNEKYGALRLPLRSPISGIVLHADVSLGKFVEPSEHLFEIVDTSKVWLNIGVLEQDIHRVREGQTARVTFNSLPNKVFETKINSLRFWLDPQWHQSTAWAEIINSENGDRVLPGMNGQVELLNPGESEALTVPVASVFSDGAEQYVFVESTSTKSSSEYRKTSVVTGRRNREFIEIISGDIFPGDRVVTRGGHELSSLFFQGVLRLSSSTAQSIGLIVEPLETQHIEKVLRLDGDVEIPPQFRTSASPQLAGTVQAIFVTPGQTVQNGDVIAEVASLELQDLQLEFLKAQLDFALWRDTWTRLSQASEAVPRRTLLEMESRVKSLEILIASSRQKLLTVGLTSKQIDEIAQTKQVVVAFPVRAPMDGVVARFDRVLGQVVRADESLFEIHDPSRAWIQTFVHEQDSSRIHVGQSARVRLVAHPGMILNGKVARLGPVVDLTSRTQTVWIELDKPIEIALQHNMLAQISLAIGDPVSALAVPLSSVIREGLQSFVFVQRPDGTFERKRVELGREDDRFIEIKSGLNQGERVASGGVSQLQKAYATLR